MPAPTALQRAPETLAQDPSTNDALQTVNHEDNNDVVAIATDHDQGQSQSQPTNEFGGSSSLSSSAMQLDPLTSVISTEEDPNEQAEESLFSPETSSSSTTTHRREERSVRVPPHRMTPLKQQWAKIYPPLVEHLGLQVRMNIAKKSVELRTSKHTDAKSQTGAAQKGADFLQAFMLGFDLDDAIALLRLDDLYIQTFEIKDVKTLNGEHLSRAIGRIAGKDGKTKFAIENASRTRIVLADQKVHILGGFKNIGIAREAVVSLILGTPPGKVYGNLRTVGARMKERF